MIGSLMLMRYYQPCLFNEWCVPSCNDVLNFLSSLKPKKGNMIGKLLLPGTFLRQAISQPNTLITVYVSSKFSLMELSCWVCICSADIPFSILVNVIPSWCPSDFLVTRFEPKTCPIPPLYHLIAPRGNIFKMYRSWWLFSYLDDSLCSTRGTKVSWSHIVRTFPGNRFLGSWISLEILN